MKQCLTVAAILFALTAPAAGPAAAEAVVCTRVAGFVVDKDPNGVNVRAAPSIRGKRIGVLPFRKTGTVVDVTGSENGWLRITKAEDMEGAVTWKGMGWVHASRLGTSLQRRADRGTPLYSQANVQSAVLHWFAGPGDNYTAVLRACRGPWVQVTLAKKTGWLAPNNRCPLPWTTCP